jgi:hypothetical protein
MAELLAAKGYDVVAVARREARLKQLQDELERRWKVHVHPLPCDLGNPGAAVHIRDELEHRGLAVDFLVNNAGYTLAGPYIENSWEDELRFVRVIGLSVVELCRYLLPHMVEQRWGRIVNVTSVAGTMAGTPNMVLYSATKSFVHKFTEGLAAENEQYGVHCTVSAPGVTDTEAFAASEISDYVDASLFVQLAMMRPEVVARQAYAANVRGQRVVVHGWHHKAWVFMLVHTPPAVRYGLVKFVTGINRNTSTRTSATGSDFS